MAVVRMRAFFSLILLSFMLDIHQPVLDAPTQVRHVSLFFFSKAFSSDARRKCWRAVVSQEALRLPMGPSGCRPTLSTEPLQLGLPGLPACRTAIPSWVSPRVACRGRASLLGGPWGSRQHHSRPGRPSQRIRRHRLLLWFPNGDSQPESGLGRLVGVARVLCPRE